MEKSIRNNSGITLTFTDDSITWESSISRFRFPYGSIKQVKLGFMGFEITPCKGNTLTFAFNSKQYKATMQEMLTFTQNAMRNATPAEPIDLTVVKKEEEANMAKAVQYMAQQVAAANEHRMRCNVCGKIFCYTDEDVRANTTHLKQARAHAVASLFGTRMDSYGQQSRMDSELNKVVDYSRCPACHSNNITELPKEENVQEVESAPSSTTSAIDEVKKYKELLDMGIITQEEFDAKKKQLLGL